MSAAEIIRIEKDNTLSFGNYMLQHKAKVEDFAFQGDVFKVKTYKIMTKLEKNGMFLYESVPGTSVTHFQEMGEGPYFHTCFPSHIQQADHSQNYRKIVHPFHIMHQIIF